MRVLIGFLGVAGSGKDTAADFMEDSLSANGVTAIRCPLSGAIKDIGYRLFSGLGVPSEAFRGSQSQKAEAQCGLSGHCGREFLEDMGELGRKYNSDTWIDLAVGWSAPTYTSPLFALIPDVRFSNEVEYILNAGGYLITLLRDPSHEKPRASRWKTDLVALDTIGNLPADNPRVFVIDNHRFALSELENCIDEATRRILSETNKEGV